MRFLCLHGAGTSTQVLETQTAALRYELEQYHTFDFVEGIVKYPMAPAEIKSFFPADDQYFAYFSHDSAESLRTALLDFSTFLGLEGPYDAVLAFSHGASLISTYILQRLLNHPSAPLPFKCAVFISGTYPLDPRALEAGEFRVLKGPEEGLPLLPLPTAHVWDITDRVCPGGGQALWDMCKDSESWKALHHEGHNVPSARSKKDIIQAVRVIQRAVDRSSSVRAH
ncbi:hypothetical protein G7Y89_g2824 [Cudoniella acicularis]|uniref:Serine hydrolase domain-containing protein n=1 Tax=Cudoniella acicularis TaxID=354080 RepID=A0A8H4W6L1_9HELO|nr:hypothetical protein G7Y89_g2824 [Cudoniella acicularis]